MAANPNQKNYLLGGVMFCVFPAFAFLMIYLEGKSPPMWGSIFLGVCFVSGVRAVMASLLWIDLEGVVSWLFDAVATAGFAVFCFCVAWTVKDGWSGDLPLIPHSWNQMIARVLFALMGLLCVLGTGRCLKKALHVYRGQSDEGMRHT